MAGRVPTNASNQAMQRTPFDSRSGRATGPLRVLACDDFTFNLQPRAPSPAVADLVTR